MTSKEIKDLVDACNAGKITEEYLGKRTRSLINDTDKRISPQDVKDAFDCLLDEHVDEDYEHRNVIAYTKTMVYAYLDIKEVVA